MESKSEIIYSFLEQKISRGEYKPGDRLPSEAELCSEFKVSRGPVRAALDQLRAIGLVNKIKGGGSYVSEQDSSNFLNVVLPTLKMGSGDFDEILELRCSLDKLIIDLCLKSHGSNDYRELDSVMAAMEKKRGKEDIYNLARAFHTILSGLCGNSLVHNINLLLWDMLQHYPRELNQGKKRDELIADHRKIYDCIKENDAELAGIYSVRHLQKLMSKGRKKQLSEDEEHHRWNPWLYDTL